MFTQNYFSFKVSNSF